MPAVAQRTTIRATAIRTPVTLDGGLDEPFWTTTDSIHDFRQREPIEGSPATERTVVKVAHDADALYIAVRCYDSDARGVRASQLRRDADLSSDDNVRILIDGCNDRRSAFVFATNPNGAQWDGQFSGVDDLNENWNGIWDVAVSRDSAGWTAEFRIPLLALRFHGGTNPEFGFNVRRFIRRKNEEDLWRSYGRAQGLYHLNNEGRITDLGDLRRPHDVELYPYALGRAVEAEHDSVGGETAGGYLGGKGGVDAKVGLTPTLTADVTVNTDFAQVEADQQVINLTRFPFFFPEKRQFFLESSGLLDYGTPGMVQLFYSRRLGLDTSGAPVPIIAGGRVYGRRGPRRPGRRASGRRRRRSAARHPWDEPRAESVCGGEPDAGRCRHADRLADLDRQSERSVRQFRLALSYRRRLRTTARLRAADRHLGDQGPHGLHAPTPRARHPAARFQVDPRMGHHRQRVGIARPRGGLADRMVRVALPRRRPGERRPLRGERAALPGRAHRHLRHLSGGEDPTRPLLVVPL